MFHLSYFNLHCRYCGVLIKQSTNKHELNKEHICSKCNQTNMKPSWQIYAEHYQQQKQLG